MHSVTIQRSDGVIQGKLYFTSQGLHSDSWVRDCSVLPDNSDPAIPEKRKVIAEHIEDLLIGQTYFDCLAILEAVKAEFIQRRFAPQIPDESAAKSANNCKHRLERGLCR